jgi:hypothetical protein
VKSWLVLFGVVLVLLSGCQTATPTGVTSTPKEPTQMVPITFTSEPGSQSTAIMTLVTPPVPTVTKQPFPTATVTPRFEMLIPLDELPSGFYVTYYNLKSNTLEAISLQGKTYILAEVNGVFEHSDNSVHTMVNQSILHIRTGENTVIAERDEDCSQYSISGSGDLIAANCVNSGVDLFSVESEWQTLLPVDVGYPDVKFPSLSMEKQKLAFCMKDTEVDSGQSTYIVELNKCLLQENCPLRKIAADCAEETHWSPDAQMLSLSFPERIMRVDLVQKISFDLVADTEKQFNNGAAWSPDGKWLAYVSADGTGQAAMHAINLISLHGGEPKQLMEAEHSLQMVGWMNIITPFAEGNSYMILPSEMQHWMKSEPGAIAKNTKRLPPGDRIRVLSQHSIVDGVTWWRVLFGGTVGWVVENPDWFQDDWKIDLLSPVFVSGYRLVVTEAGVDVRLREAPSLASVVKRSLMPGVRLKVIDGPAIVDDFRWWLVVLDESGITGWVVEDPLWYAGYVEK